MPTARHPSSLRLPYWLRRFLIAFRRAEFYWLIELACAIALVAAIWATYGAFSRAPEGGALLPSAQTTGLLISTLLPAMALLVLLGRRLALRRAEGSTARLHVRLVFLFSLIAAVPTLLFAAFAGALFQFGVDFWFSADSRGLMENANKLARGYYEQNQVEVGNETVAMAGDLRAYLQQGTIVDDGFSAYYGYQAQGRDMSESVILQQQRDGTLRTAAVLNLRDDNSPVAFVARRLERLRQGQPVEVEVGRDRIEAVAPIDPQSGVYLYTARNSDADSFGYWQRADSIARSYANLTNRARALQLRFLLALYLASLALVGLAVWFALRVADRQVQPLTRLVTAARQVGGGNFKIRVQGAARGDEIGMLNRAFNRMAAQIERQTDALVAANRQLDERRGFIEAVLGSVSAGVIYIDGEGRVSLMNSSAQRVLFGRTGPVPPSLTLHDISSELASLVASGKERGILTYNRDGEVLTLVVRTGREAGGRVITFDDITRQVLDQRQAAWSDVARRIAHEIKNPLTPIQLATERLRRRYRPQIENDGELFDELTATIVRQVGDLRKMVDEFSSFARLPKPVFREEDLLDLVRQSVFLQEVANPAIRFSVDSTSAGSLLIECDRHQIAQVVTNVVKNAVEAIEAREHRPNGFQGRVDLSLSDAGPFIELVVQDNGIGLPKDVERLVEPYVTTREKGTGLGLAIVNRIVEEHGGGMSFAAAPEGGTRISIRIARSHQAEQPDAAE